MISETAYYHSPLGCIEIRASKLGLQNIRILSRPVPEYIPDLDILHDTIEQLKEFFNKERVQFDLLLDWSNASIFYQKVWRTVCEIPYGSTCSYEDIAKKIGNSKAIRAVGRANGQNPIPIIVPCHRVIGKNGKLTGYAYGLECKRQLLHLENPNAYSKQGQLF